MAILQWEWVGSGGEKGRAMWCAKLKSLNLVPQPEIFSGFATQKSVAQQGDGYRVCGLEAGICGRPLHSPGGK